MGGVTAVILCGGLGTRVRHLLGDTPKALAPVGGRPFITYLLDYLITQGVRAALLCTGVGHEQVRGALGYSRGPLSLAYSVESTPLGTAGALRQALPLVQGDPVLVLNGDTFTRFGLAGMLAEHRLAHHQGIPNHVMQWLHTPDPPCWGVRAGADLASRYCLGSFPCAAAPVSWENDVLPLWGHCNRFLFSRVPFLDVGTPEGLAGAEDFLRSQGALP